MEAQNISGEFLITKEFNTAIAFSQSIERTVVARGIGYMEALVEYCETRGIEAEAVVVLISPALKDKLRHEAEKLNLLVRSSGELTF